MAEKYRINLETYFRDPTGSSKWIPRFFFPPDQKQYFPGFKRMKLNYKMLLSMWSVFENFLCILCKMARILRQYFCILIQHWAASHKPWKYNKTGTEWQKEGKNKIGEKKEYQKEFEFEFCVVYWHLVSVRTFGVMHDHTLFHACKSSDQTDCQPGDCIWPVDVPHGLVWVHMG